MRIKKKKKEEELLFHWRKSKIFSFQFYGSLTFLVPNQWPHHAVSFWTFFLPLQPTTATAATISSLTTPAQTFRHSGNFVISSQTHDQLLQCACVAEDPTLSILSSLYSLLLHHTYTHNTSINANTNKAFKAFSLIRGLFLLRKPPSLAAIEDGDICNLTPPESEKPLIFPIPCVFQTHPPPYAAAPDGWVAFSESRPVGAVAGVEASATLLLTEVIMPLGFVRGKGIDTPAICRGIFRRWSAGNLSSIRYRWTSKVGRRGWWPSPAMPSAIGLPAAPTRSRSSLRFFDNPRLISFPKPMHFFVFFFFLNRFIKN